MKKIFPFIFLLLCPCAFADIIDEGYVSPESYAVNEADLLDYRYVEPSPKLNVDTLESMRFKKEDTDGNISSDKKSLKKAKKEKTKKTKEEKAEKEKNYKEGIVYKSAKWWVDQRYKREEPHHGSKHEIKIKAREEYEKRIQEQAQQAI